MAALSLALFLPSGTLDANAASSAERAAAGEGRPSVQVQNSYREAVTFNSGWRWVYRKKIVDKLVKEVISDDAVDLDALRAALSVRGSDMGEVIKGAHGLMDGLHREDPVAAEVLRAVITFLENQDASLLENALRERKAGAYHGIGYLLLGRYYEKKGFYPEANGYYLTVKKSGPPRSLSEAATFLSGRAQFFQGRFSAAKKAFETFISSGNPIARRWLANTNLIRGEEDLAWGLYSDSAGFVPLDPVTRLSLADAMLARGEYEPARLVFAELESIYKDEHMMSAFFSVRKADTYLAQGLFDEAVAAYAALKQNSKNEPWAVASLALADALELKHESDARSRASKLYRSIVDGEFIGTEAAYLGLVKTQAALGKYESAVNLMRRFHSRFPASSFRSAMKDLGGEVVYRWTDELYRNGDYYGVARVDAVFAADVPFGKKAEVYLKAGIAASELGLLDTAARHLNMAVKVGSDAVAEKAMIGLAGVYIDQNDWHGADRLLDAYDERFSKKGALRASAQRLSVLAAGIKGDMKAVASSKSDPADAEALMAKAAAMAGIKRYAEATALYKQAARLFVANGKDEKVIKALIGSADAGFSAGDYRNAAAAYREAESLLNGQNAAAVADRPWVLYRLAHCYSNLRMTDEKDQALKDLASIDGEMKDWAEALFRDIAIQDGKRSGT